MSGVWASTVYGVSTAATATKDGFVSVCSGGAEYIGDGYEWCEDTTVWAWTGTSGFFARTFGCDGSEKAKA